MPDQVNRLTLYQALVLFGAFCPEDGKVKLSPDEARNLVGIGRRAKKELKKVGAVA